MEKTVTFAVGAMLLYTGWAFLAKVATGGLPAEQAVVYTYTAGIGVAVTYVAVSGERLVTAPGSIGIALVAGLFLGGGTIAYYLALRSGSAAIATGISGMYILGTAILAVTVLDESLTAVELTGLGFAVVAVILLSR
ncbi:EamA family transporter [Natrinema gelatinilyticum]|uniref:EamA family transporter n=1 Tax=Natrinema gelatinilyticum TaxID=2961571 RepID=UPI0020C5A85B|nr:EamA family transporter [Natrinema gelatinilyticum]